MQSSHLSPFIPYRQFNRLGRGLGGVLLASLVLLSGCDDKAPQRRTSSTALRTGQGTKEVQQAPGGGYVESSENAQDRAEAVNRVCHRKASSDLPSCWSAEVDRTKNRKLEARIGVMLTISPQGKAEKVDLISTQPELHSLEQCVVEAARSWSYPDGTATALVRCDFFLRSSQ
jgi:hypothetical protein